MSKINRKIEYALMSLKLMSEKIPGELTSAKEVSDRLNTPFDATARVMQVMAQRGLLRSEQGATGGYQIFKDLNKISLQDLIEMIDGPTGITKCIHGESACEIQQTCNIASPIVNLNSKLSEFYKSVSLKELLVEAVPAKRKKMNTEEALHG